MHWELHSNFVVFNTMTIKAILVLMSPDQDGAPAPLTAAPVWCVQVPWEKRMFEPVWCVQVPWEKRMLEPVWCVQVPWEKRMSEPVWCVQVPWEKRMSEMSSLRWWKDTMSSSVSAFTTRKLPSFRPTARALPSGEKEQQRPPEETSTLEYT